MNDSLFDIPPRDVPKLPQEYIGKTNKGCGYTTDNPREWTDNEIIFMLGLKEQGYTLTEIAESLGRGEKSVSIKLKRLGKRDESYNKDHREAKYEANKRFIDEIKPITILDLYCGTESYYRALGNGLKVTTNDIDPTIDADYHESAERVLMRLRLENKTYDMIDLDPYGSAYDCFDLAIKMAKKVLIVTFGEVGHKRFKRLDFVKRYYGIESLEDFTIDKLIAEVQRIGARNKKVLTPIITCEWNRISRVYFKIDEMKITEQWHQNTTN